MQVHQIYTGSSLRNFAYIIQSDDGASVFCIDPYDDAQIADFLDTRGLALTHIVNTHEHHDHTRGNAGLRSRYPRSRILAHEGAARSIPEMDEGLRAGQVLAIEDGAALRVLDTPGHTFTHVCLLLQQGDADHAVFSGDTLFNAGVGNCRSGDPGTLYDTIAGEFHTLGDDVRLYPGHEYMENNLRFTLEYDRTNSAARDLLGDYEREIRAGRYIVSTIGLERDINTFFRLDSEELRRDLKKHFSNINERSSERDVFLALRKLRDAW